MNGQPSIEDLARQFAVLVERMHTHQARCEAGLERIAYRIADRGKQQQLAIAGIGGFATAIPGVLALS